MDEPRTLIKKFEKLKKKKKLMDRPEMVNKKSEKMFILPPKNKNLKCHTNIVLCIYLGEKL